MPKLQGVYRAGNGSWYFRATLGRDPLSGKARPGHQAGFATATDAARARRELLEQADGGGGAPRASLSMTVGQLLDEYLDGIDTDGRLSPKTRHDYRRNADAYVQPWPGEHRVRALTPGGDLAWQRQVSEGTGTRRGRPLAPEHGPPRPGVTGRGGPPGGRVRRPAHQPTGLSAAAQGAPIHSEALVARAGPRVPGVPGRAPALPRCGRSCWGRDFASASSSGCAGGGRSVRANHRRFRPPSSTRWTCPTARCSASTSSRARGATRKHRLVAPRGGSALLEHEGQDDADHEDALE